METVVTPHEDARTARYRAAEHALWQHYGLEPRERFVEVGSPSTRIRIVEIGSGHPLFFVQGTAGSGPAFAALIKELPEYRCLIIDRPGFGLSAPIRYSARTFGKTVADLQRDVLDALGVQQVDVIGHSIGAVFALRLALHRPERVRRVVVLGAGPIVQDAGIPIAIRRIASPIGGLMVQVIKLRRATAGMIRGNGHGPSLDSGQIPGVFVDWRTAVNRETDSMVHERAMVRELITNSSYRPELTFTDAELAAIEQPTLMLYGTGDAVGSQSVWRRVMNTVPDGRLIVVDGAGHMLWLDQPMTVAAELRAFLGED